MTNRLADEAAYFGAVADGAASRNDEIAELRQQVTLLRDAIEAIWTNPNWKPDTMPRALIDQLQTAYKGELK